jgi:hypothetical protein
MYRKMHFTAVDTALTGMFCAVWTALNLTLGPLSFQLLALPVLHDFGVFFTLLLVAWVTGTFGTSTLAGIIGSVFSILLGGPVLIVCFAVAAVLFDLLMFGNHHRIRGTRLSLTITVIATLASAYVAGVLIGVFFTSGETLQWALTVWGGWHVVGGAMAAAVTLPLILSLEKANVRRIKGDGQ